MTNETCNLAVATANRRKYHCRTNLTVVLSRCDSLPVSHAATMSAA